MATTLHMHKNSSQKSDQRSVALAKFLTMRETLRPTKIYADTVAQLPMLDIRVVVIVIVINY